MSCTYIRYPKLNKTSPMMRDESNFKDCQAEQLKDLKFLAAFLEWSLDIELLGCVLSVG